MTQDLTPSAANGVYARGKRGNYDARLDEVLRAAARLFSEHGFRQATLEDVASVLNITRPALYHYARSKDELVGKCHDIAIATINDAIADARRLKTGREQLAAFFRRYAEIICDDFGRCFVLVNRREYSPELEALNRAAERQIDLAVREMVRAGTADGSLQAVDEADVSRALFGAFNGVPRWYRPNGRRTPGQIADDFLVLLMGGVAP